MSQPATENLFVKARAQIEKKQADLPHLAPADLFDENNPEHVKLLNVMKVEHPEMPEYILLNALRFYLADCLPKGAKRRGRPLKARPPQPQEIKGAVSISPPMA